MMGICLVSFTNASSQWMYYTIAQFALQQQPIALHVWPQVQVSGQIVNLLIARMAELISASLAGPMQEQDH